MESQMPAETALDINFEVGMYRPPSEGGSHSLLVRVTRNCPWNRCEFCAMYKTEKFTLRSPTEVKTDIDTVAHICQELSGPPSASNGITRDAALKILEHNPQLGSSVTR